MNTICPKCGTPLQENAQFCPHCMTVLVQKPEAEKPKKRINNKKKIALIILAIVLALSVAAAGIFAVFYKKNHSPICSYAQFRLATIVASERNGIDDLWDAHGFVDTQYFKKEKVTRYTTDVYLKDAYLGVFFYNEGEEVYAYLYDVKESDFEDAKKILKCITQSICNNYFSDLDDIMDNRNVYPRKQLDAPFRKGFTDLLNRTDQYYNDIKNGAEISTEYIGMVSGEFLIYYTVTERKMPGETLFDLGIEVERS